MTDTGRKTESSKGRIGCAVIALAVAGLAVGGGVFLSRHEDSSKSPCERYARTMARVLDNCHSGKNRNHAYHVAACEKSVNPTDACLERIESLPCDQLEIGPTAAGPVCRK
jgi:hypothetical protein